MRTISRSSAGEGFRLPYLTGVAGIILAVGLAVSLGGWQNDHRPGLKQVAAVATPRFAAVQSQPAPQMVFYLVSSQAEADYALFAESEAEAAQRAINLGGLSRTVKVLQAATQEQEEQALALIADETRDAAGALVYITDLRGR